MTVVNTVLGPLDTAALGFTLMHEHILVSGPGIPQNYPDVLDRGYMHLIVNGLNKAKDGGINTVLDATTLDLGRDPTVLYEASRRTSVNIISCTGWWIEKPRFLTGVYPERLARGFIRDVEKGMAGTDIKAGILKGASNGATVTDEEQTVLRALALAHHQTGTPIMLHSNSPLQVGRQQVAILKKYGVDLRRVKLDHSNDTTDVEYLTWLLDQGCYLGLDRYPGFGSASALARTRTLKALIDAGYKDRLCLSHDHTLAQHTSRNSPFGSAATRNKRNPQGYLYIKNMVFSQLREMGVSDKVIEGLCVNGPRNFFEGK